jgi:holo-[acyl-carrier protein] synthase
LSVRVGIDSVSVESVREALAAHGERYLQRVYTPAEQDACGGDPERLAARFAAKEAARKALRTGDGGVPWTAFEVRRDPAGHVELALHGGAAELAEAAGVCDIALSFTHEAGLATAVVVLQTSALPPASRLDQ